MADFDKIFLSTLSLRRATWSVDVPGWILGISIHALLAESDWQQGEVSYGKDWISIHALLAESDCWAPRTPGPNLYFYPRSPCGERL